MFKAGLTIIPNIIIDNCPFFLALSRKFVFQLTYQTLITVLSVVAIPCRYGQRRIILTPNTICTLPSFPQLCANYRADHCEPQTAEQALTYVPPWLDSTIDRPDFNDDHRHRLTVLSTHTLPLLPPADVLTESASSVEDSRAFLYMGLVDLLLAFTHDLRVREGEDNPESAWMISKLATTLSWLEVSLVSCDKRGCCVSLGGTFDQ